MEIKKVKFIDTEYDVIDNPNVYVLVSPSGEAVQVPKANCEIKNGYIYNKGLKFKIIA